MTKIYVNYSELEKILGFLNKVKPEDASVCNYTVELEFGEECEVGRTLLARVRGVEFKGMTVNIEKVIIGYEDF